MVSRKCRFCKSEFVAPLRGRAKLFCGSACRVAAHRAKVAFASVVQETETPAPLRHIGDASTLVHADLELLEHAAEVRRKVRALDAVEEAQMVEAEQTGRAVWRYVDENEKDLREADQAYQVWADWS